MGSLSEFQALVNDLKDPELLDVAEELLRDMIEIENMKEKMETLEDSLTKGNRAAFWWFAMGLDREQVDLATNSVIGRKRVLHDQAARAKLKEDANNPLLTQVEGQFVSIEEHEAKVAAALEAKAQLAHTKDLIAQARAGMLVEDSEGLTDQEVWDMIMEDEGGLGQLLKK